MPSASPSAAPFQVCVRPYELRFPCVLRTNNATPELGHAAERHENRSHAEHGNEGLRGRAALGLQIRKLFSTRSQAVVPESRVESASSTTAPRTNQTRRRILITTWGSLGDLHPYVALALGLQSRGHEAILATGECYRRKIEALGIGFRAVRPDCAWVADPVVMRRLTHPRWGIIRAVQASLLSLRESYEDTMAAAEGTDLLVGNMAAYATGIVAEKKGMPWVSAMHIPTGFFSAYDPPLIPGFPGISKGLRGLGPKFWGPFGRSINRIASVKVQTCPAESFR